MLRTVLAVALAVCLVLSVSATPPQTPWNPEAEPKKPAAPKPAAAAPPKPGDCVPGKKVYTFSGKIEKFTAPKGCIVTIKAWGAGGGNGGQFAPGGGGGGFAKANIVGIGQTLNVLVGEGPVGHIENDNAWPGQGPFFGGGGHQGNFCGHNGGGGGRSEVTLAVGGRVLLVAGGGGGGGCCKEALGGVGGGGDGGGCEPQASLGGRGANQMSGHKRNEGASGGDTGAGGGGGYYGGFAGNGHCQYGGGGGGGSSYFSPSLTFGAKLVSGVGYKPGSDDDEDYGDSSGKGGTGIMEGGKHGRVVFTWRPK